MEPAILNVTYNGQQGDLPDDVPFDLTTPEVIDMAEEGIKSGSILGIDADPEATLQGFKVERYPAKDDKPNRLVVRPSVPFGEAASKTGEKLRQRRESRFAKMSDEEVREQAEDNLRKLHELTGGFGDEALMRANSVRFAWKELLRRGLPDLDTEKIRDEFDRISGSWRK